MSKYDVPAPDDQIQCPYDDTHMIDASRMQYHIIKCRKSYPNADKAHCPFNHTHVVNRAELRYHMSRCKDRVRLGGDMVNHAYQDEKTKAQQGNLRAPPVVSTWTPPESSENWDEEDTGPVYNYPATVHSVGGPNSVADKIDQEWERKRRLRSGQIGNSVRAPRQTPQVLQQQPQQQLQQQQQQQQQEQRGWQHRQENCRDQRNPVYQQSVAMRSLGQGWRPPNSQMPRPRMNGVPPGQFSDEGSGAYSNPDSEASDRSVPDNSARVENIHNIRSDGSGLLHGKQTNKPAQIGESKLKQMAGVMNSQDDNIALLQALARGRGIGRSNPIPTSMQEGHSVGRGFTPTRPSRGRGVQVASVGNPIPTTTASEERVPSVGQLPDEILNDSVLSFTPIGRGRGRGRKPANSRKVGSPWAGGIMTPPSSESDRSPSSSPVPPGGMFSMPGRQQRAAQFVVPNINGTGGVLEAATASDAEASSGSGGSDSTKDIRKLQKKIREIEVLELKKANGFPLDADEKMKLATKDEIVHKLAALQLS